MGRCGKQVLPGRPAITPQIALKPATLCFVFEPGFVRSAYVRLCVDSERSVSSGHFANVPELVWNYQLGGYPVLNLKKWLGYRQADRRDGKPLTDDERQWFRQIIQRLAALLALGPTLNELYEQTAANAFTAEELKIAR